jgi:hypothetical protein
MPEPVNTPTLGSKLNEFYEMQRMLIVFLIQSAAFDCPGYEAPVAWISALLTFDAPADLQSLIKSTPPRNWITRLVSKFFAELHQGAIRNAEPVTDASYSGSLDLRKDRV